MRLARRDNDLVAASVFVNPKQFAPGEDLEAYPAHGTWGRDLAALEAAGVDFVYAPSAEAMYPRGSGVMTPFVDLVGVDAPTLTLTPSLTQTPTLTPTLTPTPTPTLTLTPTPTPTPTLTRWAWTRRARVRAGQASFAVWRRW